MSYSDDNSFEKIMDRCLGNKILENVLKSYKGTVLFVSHDRYFINETSTRILDLTNHTMVNYIGNYDYYLEKRDELMVKLDIISESDANNSSQILSDNKVDWKKQKTESAEKRKLQNSIKRIEDDITKAEAELASLDAQLCDPVNASNSAKLNELTNSRNKIDIKLSELMEEWENLSNLLII